MIFERTKKLTGELKTFPVFGLVKNSLVYGIGDIIQRFLSIFLLPIYTRYLTPGDYGVISLLGILSMIVGVITMCGLTNGIARYFFYTDQEKTSLSDVVWSPFLFVSIVTLLFIITLGLFSGHLSIVLFDSRDYTYLVALTLAGVLVGNLSGLGRSILIFQEKSMVVNFINIAGVISGVVLGLFFVVFLKRGVTGAIEAGLVGSAIMCVVTMSVTMARFKPAFSRSTLSRQLKFSLPLVIAILAFWIIDSSDRYLLKMYLPLSEVGLYNIGYNIGLVMMIVVGGFTLAWPPYYHKNNQNNEGQSICDNVLRIYLLIASFFVVVLSLAAPLAVEILTTESFYQAYTVTPWVAMAYMLKGPYIIFLMGILMKNKTLWQLCLEGFAALANIGLNILFIPLIGREGAAITTLFSYSIMVIGAYLMVMRVNPIPKISWRYVFGITAFTFVISGSAAWAGNIQWYILFSIALFFCYTGILLFMSYREIVPMIREKVRHV